jgi:hypothetical protein
MNLEKSWLSFNQIVSIFYTMNKQTLIEIINNLTEHADNYQK